NAELGTATGNTFTGSNISSTNNAIAGGGVLGVNANNGSAKITNATGNEFTNTTVSSKTLEGGGMIGVHANSEAILETVNNNKFLTKNDVTITDELQGGGMIGVRSNNSNAELGTATGNTFTGSTISSTTDAIEGGGIVGVNSNDNGYAKIGTFNQNTFTTTKVTANTTLDGGGIVGVYAKSGNAEITNVTSNTFNTSNITSSTELVGGGIIGVHSDDSGYATIGTINNNTFNNSKIEVTNASQNAEIEGGGMIGIRAQNAIAQLQTFTNNDFDTSNVTADTLTGGGILGVFSESGNAEIVNATGNTFIDSTISTTTGDLTGGGIIGVSSTEGHALIKNLTNNTFENRDLFTGKTVNVTGDLKGGGIIGVSAGHTTESSAYAEIDQIVDNIFKSTVSVTGNLEGGGIIGVQADAGDARINNISGIGIKGLFFIQEISASSIEGGGLIGVRSEQGNASIETISNVAFSTNNINTTNGNIEGAGLIGVRSDKGNATMNSITNSTFTLNKITTNDGYIQGGGIIGVRSDSLAKINSISYSVFNSNEITSATWIDGGGIIGASGSAKSELADKYPHGGIGLIDNTDFIGNTIKANDGQIMGGLIYSYGAAGGMTIKDSLFGENKFYSKNNNIADYDAKVYGAITIDTGATPFGDDEEHVVTLISTALNQDAATGFYQNAIYEDNTETPDRYNSFYFGTMPYIDNTNLTKDYAAADARLVIASEANGYVFLLDPIAVSQDNENGNEFTFNMDIGRQDGTPSGLLIWGGKNELELLKESAVDETNSGTITMYAGSTTTLVDINSFTTLVNYGELWSDVFRSADSMTLAAPNYTVDLKNGAWLNVEGHNKWDLSYENTANPANPKVNFNGDLHFNLNNTDYYNDTKIPETYAVQGTGIPLLTIVTPDKESMIDLEGATVHLQDFLGNTPLQAGDRFYLIDATDTNNNDDQTKFINADQLANDKDSDGRFIAYARQGLTRGYYFIIDLNGEHKEETLVDSHYLTARLRSAEVMPAKELVPPAEGRITGVSFLNHLATPKLYDIDPQCSPCVPCDPSDGYGSQWVKTPFVSITGDWYSADTSDASWFTVRGSVFQAGLAFQKKIHQSRIFLGGFFDSGYADYNTYNYIPEIKRNTDFHGDGELTATGGGVLFRRQWKNGWQFDGTIRGGSLRNKFYSGDVLIHNTDFVMKYDTDSVYYGTDLGLSHQWKIGKRRTVDLYGRYAWMYLEGNTITWNYNEIDVLEGTEQNSYSETVRFNGIHSHRLTLGARYTKKRNSNVSWYVGSALEYELDGQANGVINDVGRFDGPTLKGGYGIGEIGLIYRQKDNFQFIAGLEGYAGDRSGGNVNLSAVWKW
ncbi:MAG: autotransporter outer membrane beta-barrel domain-containing protein, partial [Planctomycetaceae bacterium]|nr:autotransporter outer membrane beta-barrel domain-containing protein [Planctomycetaceae bacterium]